MWLWLWFWTISVVRDA
jgi:mixed-linked glucan synthase